MCDEETGSSQNESNETDNAQQLSLLDLPIEILFHICSFVDATTLARDLSLVCKRFYQILRDDLLWKVRISHIWPNTVYPVLPPAEGDKMFWRLSCVALEKQANLWRKRTLMENMTLVNSHSSTIDSLLLMDDGNICLSGGRDRSIAYWRLPSTREGQKVMNIDFAHLGWIWGLTSIDNTVYSCAWDGCVKAWSLTDSALTCLHTYEKIVSTALLCLASCPKLGLFSTGSFCKQVLVFDPRCGNEPIAKYKAHQRAVLKLAMSSHFILSASEDKTLAIWDQRARKIIKNVTISETSFPMSMCMQRDMVYVGDSKANLHVLDPRRDFEPAKSYPTEHENSITGVRSGPGCLITCSKDKTVRISSPTDPPRHLATLTPGYGEVAGMDYLNGVLAISGTKVIEIWRPKERVWCL